MSVMMIAIGMLASYMPAAGEQRRSDRVVAHRLGPQMTQITQTRSWGNAAEVNQASERPNRHVGHNT